MVDELINEILDRGEELDDLVRALATEIHDHE